MSASDVVLIGVVLMFLGLAGLVAFCLWDERQWERRIREIDAELARMNERRKQRGERPWPIPPRMP